MPRYYCRTYATALLGRASSVPRRIAVGATTTTPSRRHDTCRRPPPPRQLVVGPAPAMALSNSSTYERGLRLLPTITTTTTTSDQPTLLNPTVILRQQQQQRRWHATLVVEEKNDENDDDDGSDQHHRMNDNVEEEKEEKKKEKKKVDEDSWIWHTEKNNLKRLGITELIEFCRRHDFANDAPTDIINRHIQECLQAQHAHEKSARKTTLVNIICNERNRLRKQFTEYHRHFKAKRQLQTAEQRDFYDRHSQAEIRALCKDYQITMVGKSIEKLVREFLRKQATVPKTIRDAMHHHGSELASFTQELGLTYERSKQNSCKLALARRLERLRQRTLGIHRKLHLRSRQSGGVPVPKELCMENVASDASSGTWKEQVCFYRRRSKRRILLAHVLGDANHRWAAQKCGPTLTKVCRFLKVKV